MEDERTPLRIAQVVQAERDSRAVSVPSTAHRASGLRIPRQKIAGLKTQRELGPEDLRVAILSVDEASKSEQSRMATALQRRSKGDIST